LPLLSFFAFDTYPRLRYHGRKTQDLTGSRLSISAREELGPAIGCVAWFRCEAGLRIDPEGDKRYGNAQLVSEAIHESLEG